MLYPYDSFVKMYISFHVVKNFTYFTSENCSSLIYVPNIFYADNYDSGSYMFSTVFTFSKTSIFQVIQDAIQELEVNE